MDFDIVDEANIVNDSNRFEWILLSDFKQQLGIDERKCEMYYDICMLKHLLSRESLLLLYSLEWNERERSVEELNKHK